MCRTEVLVVFTVFDPWDVSFRALCRKNQKYVSSWFILSGQYQYVDVLK